MSVDITILMNSAREDFPLVKLPDTFIFAPTVKSLNKQEVQNFELVIVDACWSEERKRWIETYAEFPVKYVNAHPNRFLKHGMCAIASMKNKGLLYAEGELVVFVDDCTEFPSFWTRRIWDWYSRGYWPMSLTYYYEAGKPKLLKKDDRYIEILYGRVHDKTENLFAYVRPGELVRDSRADTVNARGVLNAPASWFYGGSSAPLQALLRINGVDEKFDGCKGLEDSDTGLRLENAGYKGLFVLDRDLWHIEHWHKSISEKVLWYRGPTAKCNYGLLQYNRSKGEFRANEKVLSRKDCEWIRQNICPKCDNLHRCVNEEFKGKFYIECEGFETWLRLQRTFDLREERLNVEL